MQTCKVNVRASRAAAVPHRRCIRAAAGSKPVNAAATSVVPISEVQVEQQPTGFFASLQQLFAPKEESHEEDHGHGHVMFHSHIAEMMAMEVPKPKVVVPGKATASNDDEAPHFHDDHGHSHVMFHSHIAEAKAIE